MCVLEVPSGIVLMMISSLLQCLTLQDDVLSGTLTIKENVYLSATLRLPGDMDRQEKEEKVDEIIKELDLSHVADTLVPNINKAYIKNSHCANWCRLVLHLFVAYLQKKRCSIAMELVVSPGILFLDEPTTGLDSTTAESVIQLLHKLVPLTYIYVYK